MPKKKGTNRTFNKKTGQQFAVVHRSQQDPLYGQENATDYVLTPINAVAAEKEKTRRENREKSMTKEEKEIRRRRLLGDRFDEMGLPIDGYDYSQHLKTIDGSGTFIGPNGRVADPLTNVYNKVIDHSRPEDQIDRKDQLEAIAIDTKAMPSDMQKALSGRAGAVEFEELTDDFVVEAAKEYEGDNKEPLPFDFNAYYKKLMAGETSASSVLEEESTKDEDEDEDDVESAPEAVRQNRMLDDHFDVVMNQYDDEEIGELDDEDPRLEDGLLGMDNNKLLEDALGDFEHYDRLLMNEMCETSETDRTIATDDKANNGSNVQSAIAAAVAKTKGNVQGISALAIDADEDEETSEDEDDKLGIDKYRRSDKNETADDGDDIASHSWFERKEKAKWDCESVLSTYSNLDNRPTTIGRHQGLPSAHRIRLSKKTGLPIMREREKKKNKKKTCVVEDVRETFERIELCPDEDVHDDAFESCVTRVRSRNETKAEKRERKRLVKEERRRRRMQKKETKNAFKKAEKQVKKHETTDKMTGRSITRYS